MQAARSPPRRATLRRRSRIRRHVPREHRERMLSGQLRGRVACSRVECRADELGELHALLLRGGAPAGEVGVRGFQEVAAHGAASIYRALRYIPRARAFNGVRLGSVSAASTPPPSAWRPGAPVAGRTPGRRWGGGVQSRSRLLAGLPGAAAEPPVGVRHLRDAADLTAAGERAARRIRRRCRRRDGLRGLAGLAGGHWTTHDSPAVTKCWTWAGHA